MSRSVEPILEWGARRGPVLLFAVEPDRPALSYVSANVQRILGWAPEDLLGSPRRWLERIHPEDRSRVLNGLRSTGEADCRVRGKGGGYHRMRILVDEAGPGNTVLGYAIDLGAETEAGSRDDEREALLEAVSGAVQRILSARTWEDVAEKVLEEIGRAAGATRTFLYQRGTLDGRGGGAVRAEWTATPRERSAGSPASGVFMAPRWEALLRAGENVVGGVDDLSPGDALDLRPRGVDRVVIVPVLVAGDLWGYLAVEGGASERRWDEGHARVLRAATEALGAVIERSRTEATHRTMVEMLPVAVYVERLGDSYSPDYSWATDYASPQIEALTGHPPEAWTHPERWFRMIHPDDRESARREDSNSAETGERFDREYRVVRPDGSVVWLRDEAVLVRDRHDRPLFWQGVVSDCTARKASEQRLEETQAGYRSLIESMPAVVYVDELDERATSRFIGPQIEEMLGFGPDTWIADPELWEKCLHPDDRERVLAENHHHNITGEPFESDYRMVACDGRVVWVHDQAVLVRDADGGPLFSQGVLFDITERKRAEEALQRALEREREVSERLRTVDEMKSTFLNAVSHELRTPLTSVLGYAATLEREDIELSSEQEREFVRNLARNARKLDRLLGDLLDLDRLTRGVLELRRDRTDVLALVRGVLGDMQLAGRDVRVDAEALIAHLDGSKVERIVENLVANVLKHTPQGSPVSVRVRGSGDAVLIAVEDEGPGVPDEQKQAIFRPFEHGTTTGVHGWAPGAGVGLSLVARFAEMHGGRAWVEDRPGGGSSFHVRLPGSLGTSGGGDPGRPGEGLARAGDRGAWPARGR